MFKSSVCSYENPGGLMETTSIVATASGHIVKDFIES